MDRCITDRRISGVDVATPDVALFPTGGTFEFVALAGFGADLISTVALAR